MVSRRMVQVKYANAARTRREKEAFRRLGKTYMVYSPDQYPRVLGPHTKVRVIKGSQQPTPFEQRQDAIVSQKKTLPYDYVGGQLVQARTRAELQKKVMTIRKSLAKGKSATLRPKPQQKRQLFKRRKIDVSQRLQSRRRNLPLLKKRLLEQKRQPARVAASKARIERAKRQARYEDVKAQHSKLAMESAAVNRRALLMTQRLESHKTLFRELGKKLKIPKKLGKYHVRRAIASGLAGAVTLGGQAIDQPILLGSAVRAVHTGLKRQPRAVKSAFKIIGRDFLKKEGIPYKTIKEFTTPEGIGALAMSIALFSGPAGLRRLATGLKKAPKAVKPSTLKRGAKGTVRTLRHPVSSVKHLKGSIASKIRIQRAKAQRLRIARIRKSPYSKNPRERFMQELAEETGNTYISPSEARTLLHNKVSIGKSSIVEVYKEGDALVVRRIPKTKDTVAQAKELRAMFRKKNNIPAKKSVFNKLIKSTRRRLTSRRAQQKLILKHKRKLTKRMKARRAKRARLKVKSALKKTKRGLQSSVRTVKRTRSGLVVPVRSHLPKQKRSIGSSATVKTRQSLRHKRNIQQRKQQQKIKTRQLTKTKAPVTKLQKLKKVAPLGLLATVGVTTAALKQLSGKTSLSAIKRRLPPYIPGLVSTNPNAPGGPRYYMRTRSGYKRIYKPSLKALILNIIAKRAPTSRSGLGVRPIIKK